MYTTWGSVTGDCGHVHATAEEAYECIVRHNKACKQHCGDNAYSDRRIRVIQAPEDIQSYDVTRGPGRPLQQ